MTTNAVCAFEGVDERDALDYLSTVYGARITTVAELVNEPVATGASRVVMRSVEAKAHGESAPVAAYNSGRGPHSR